MPGTKEGAKKMWETRRARGDHLNKEKYSEMGKKSHAGGFSGNPEFARQMQLKRWEKVRTEKEKNEKPKSTLSKIAGIFRGV